MGVKAALKVIREAIEKPEKKPEETKEYLIWGNDWKTRDEREEKLRKEVKEAGDDLEDYEWMLELDEEGNPVLDEDGSPKIDDERLSEGVWDDVNNIAFDLAKESCASLDRKYAKIVLDASLGLWDGRHNGVKVLDCFTDIFDKIEMYDGMRLTYQNGDVWGEIVHHDGTNTFVVWGITDEKLSEFYDRQEEDPDFYDQYPSIEDLAYDYCVNENASEEFEKYFERVGPELAKIYGWK